jgi:hypothetical protein
MRQNEAPNPHKALGVKRKYFPRGRLSTAFSCRISERVSQRRRRILHGDPAWVSAADAAHARPAAEANRTQHSCGLRRPGPVRPSGCARNVSWPVPVLMRSQGRRHSRYDWLAPPKGRPVRHGWRLGRIVRAKAPRVPGSRFGGGREDVGMATSQARFLGTAHAEPVCPPTHRRAATPLRTTAVEIVGRGRRPFKAAGCLGGPGPRGGVTAPRVGEGRRAG